MSYIDEGRGYRGMKYGAGALGAVAVIALGRMALMGAAHSLPSTPTSPIGAERALLDDKAVGSLFATIKRTYPDEFESMKNDIARRGQAFEANDEVRSALVADLAGAEQRHRGDMAQAPHQALVNYREAEIAMVEALQSTDPSLCADYFTTGAFRTATPPPLLRSRNIDFQQQVWTAAAAGRDSPVGRKIDKPGPAVGRALFAGMAAAGYDQKQVDAFFHKQPAPAAQQCAMGLAFLRTIDSLPADKADGFVAYAVTHI